MFCTLLHYTHKHMHCTPHGNSHSTALYEGLFAMAGPSISVEQNQFLTTVPSVIEYSDVSCLAPSHDISCWFFLSKCGL